MNTDPLGNRAVESSATGRFDSTGLPPTAATGVMGVPAVEVDVADVPMRDRIRWGPIIAGVVTAFTMPATFAPVLPVRTDFTEPVRRTGTQGDDALSGGAAEANFSSTATVSAPARSAASASIASRDAKCA